MFSFLLQMRADSIQDLTSDAALSKSPTFAGEFRQRAFSDVNESMIASYRREVGRLKKLSVGLGGLTDSVTQFLFLFGSNYFKFSLIIAHRQVYRRLQVSALFRSQYTSRQVTSKSPSKS